MCVQMMKMNVLEGAFWEVLKTIDNLENGSYPTDWVGEDTP